MADVAMDQGKSYSSAQARLSRPKRKPKNFIKTAIKHPGALHKEMGVPQGEKIPEGRLRKAASAGGKLGRRARFAEMLRGLK